MLPKGKGESDSVRAKKEIKPFGMRDKIGYGLGDFGCNMSFAFANNYMQLFFVTCMHIDPVHYAFIILISKILDAMNDIVIGRLCDRAKHTDGGKFLPWIRWGCIPLLVTSVLLFVDISRTDYWFRVVYCLVVYFFWGIAYTAVNVPYGSLQSVITKDGDQRASLSTYRSVGAMLAQIPLMILVPKLIYDQNDDPVGSRFVWIVLVMGILGLVAFTALTKLVTERVHDDKALPEELENTNIFFTLRAFFRNRPLLGLCFATIAQISCLNTLTSYLHYIFMLYYKNTDLISIAVVICGLPMVVGIFLSKPLLHRFTKKQVCTYPFILSILCTAVITFIPLPSPYAWMAFAGIAMMGTSCFMVLIWAMVSDCIDYQEELSGKREEGTIYAIYSFCRNASQGVGQGITALALAWTGYDENLTVAQQAATVADRVRFTTGLIPFVGCVLCFVFLLVLYNLGDKKGDETFMEQLNQKKKGKVK